MLQFKESATGALVPSSFSPAILGTAWTNIASATQTLDGALQSVTSARDDGIQMVMDSMRAAQKTTMGVFLKGNAASNKPKRDISDMFAGFVADGLMESNTAKMYASSYWLCYEEGKPFDYRARINKAEAAKAAKAEGVSVEKTSAKTTTIETLEGALVKTLAIARVLQHTTAGALLDLILEINPKFEESK